MSVDTLTGAYGLELLYPQPPWIDKRALLTELRDRLGAVDSLVGDLPAFVAHDFPVEPHNGVSGAMIFIADSKEVFDPTTARVALEQTWNWPGAGSTLPRCQYSVVLIDMFARTLDPWRRWQLVRGALSALVAVAPPSAIHWTPAQKLVDPYAGLDDPLLPINARLFRLEGRLPGECVMDTLGLSLFGLNDLQCHFVGLEPDQVAAYLLDIAGYLLEHGQPPVPGQTLAGVNGRDAWHCFEATALMAPSRPVLAIRPSPQYAIR